MDHDPTNLLKIPARWHFLHRHNIKCLNMNSIASESSDRPRAIADSGLTMDQLRAWYQEYMDADEDPELSPLIQAVQADKLDHRYIERRVQELAASVHISEGLCAKCQYDFQNWSDPPPQPSEGVDGATVGRAVNTLELEAAAIAGCQYCALWLCTVNRYYPEGLAIYRKLEARLQLLKSKGTASFGITSYSWDSDMTGVPSSQHLWLNLPGKMGSAYRTSSGLARLSAVVGFESARMRRNILDPIETAKAWLNDCVATHANCRSGKTFDAPTRLVSIGNDEVKLSLTKNMEKRPPYATLSYCWGTKPFLMLTSRNLDSFLCKIEDSELPKTFQDAILIARGLGLSYLWIDALCIVQDGEDDWLREAGRMRSVYGGSLINIAATSALDAYQGCFNKPKHHSSGFHAQITTKTHSRTQAFYPDDVHEEYIKGPLSRRGWAMQERILPPRTLSSGERGFFWQCRCATRSEFLPNQLPYDGIGIFHTSLVSPENEPWPWDIIVERYSRGKLTHGSDRLPALSGIATRQHEVTGDSYLAGMWRGKLIWQLAWHIVEPAERKERPAWRAPTWSWASIDSPIGCIAPLDDSEKQRWAHVLDAWTTPSGPDRFGPVSGGVLTLGCVLLLCGHLSEERKYVTFDAHGPEANQSGNPTMTIPIVMDCVIDEPPRTQSPVYLLPLFDLGPGELQDCQESGATPGSEQPEEREVAWAVGIILQRCGSTPGHFCRIGFFKSDNTIAPEYWAENQDGGYDDFLRVLEHVGPGAAKAECARILSDEELSNLGLSETQWKGDTKPRYVITIE